MNFRSKNHFLEFSRFNRKLAPERVDTRRTRRVPGRGSSGVVRGLPGGPRLGTRGATGGIRGHSPGTRVAAHSGFSPGESRDTWRLGGLPEEGFHSALGDRWQLGRHPGEILPVRGIRGRVAAREESGRRSVSHCTRNTWRVPRVFRRRLSEGLAA